MWTSVSPGLEAVNFLAARGCAGGMLVTLMYSRPIGDAWLTAGAYARSLLSST